MFQSSSEQSAFNLDQNLTKITVNDLSKDFMQILNLPKTESQVDDSKYLLCEIDPSSLLYQPIESLRKILLKESDDEEDYKSGVSDQESPEVPGQIKRKKPKKRERTQLEIYMDSIEQEYRKKIKHQEFDITLIKELQQFYQNCFTQFIYDLAPINFDMKKIANRISCGMDLLFQTMLRHHCKEIQEYRKMIEGLKEENTNLKISYNYLKNDIQHINKLIPQVRDILEKTQNFNPDLSFEALNDMPTTERQKYMDQIFENEENLQALAKIEQMIEIRKSHNFKQKAKELGFTLDQYQVSQAEDTLKVIFNDIRDQQNALSHEQRALEAYEKEEHEIRENLEKQKRVLEKDWIGERNSKIGVVQKKLVDKMILKLNKPLTKVAAIQTESKIIYEEDYQRLEHLNNEYHKQLAQNGTVLMLKEKQIERITSQYLQADLNWKRSERTLNDIKVLNSVKKEFLTDLKKQYEHILVGILNICMRYASDILDQNEALKTQTIIPQSATILDVVQESQKNHNITSDSGTSESPQLQLSQIEQTQRQLQLDQKRIVEILNAQKKSTEQYLLGLNESRKFMDLLLKEQIRFNINKLKEQEEKKRKELEKARKSSPVKKTQPKIQVSRTIQSLKESSKNVKKNLSSSKKNSANNSDSESSSDSFSSTDSVTQLMNSKIQYNNEHIRNYEEARLKQRFSIGPQILKKQIVKLNQNMKDFKDSQTDQLQKYDLFQPNKVLQFSFGNYNQQQIQEKLDQILKEKEKTKDYKPQDDSQIMTNKSMSNIAWNDSFKKRDSIRNMPVNQTILNTEKKQNTDLKRELSLGKDKNKTLIDESPFSQLNKTQEVHKTLARKSTFTETFLDAEALIQKARSQYQGTGIKKEDSSFSMQKESREISPRTIIDRTHETLSLGGIELDQEYEEVLEKPDNFDLFVQEEEQMLGHQVVLRDDILEASAAKKSIKGLKRSGTATSASLEQIEEVAEEKDSQDGNQIKKSRPNSRSSSRIASAKKKSRGTSRGKATFYHDKPVLKDFEIQVDLLPYDDYTSQMKASLAYLNEIVDNHQEFKSEIQSNFLSAKMMSEAKINLIRQIVKHFVQKSQSESIVRKWIENPQSQLSKNPNDDYKTGSLTLNKRFGSQGSKEGFYKSQHIRNLTNEFNESSQKFSGDFNNNTQSIEFQSSDRTIPLNQTNFFNINITSQHQFAGLPISQSNFQMYEGLSKQKLPLRTQQTFGRPQMGNKSQVNDQYLTISSDLQSNLNSSQAIPKSQMQTSKISSGFLASSKIRSGRQSFNSQQDQFNQQWQAMKQYQQSISQERLKSREKVSSRQSVHRQLNETQINNIIVNLPTLQFLNPIQNQELMQAVQRKLIDIDSLAHMSENEISDFLEKNKHKISQAIDSKRYSNTIEDQSPITLSSIYKNQDLGQNQHHLQDKEDLSTINEEQKMSNKDPNQFTFTSKFYESKDQADQIVEKSPMGNTELEKFIQTALPSQLQQLLEQSTSEAQKFYYLRMIDEQQQRMSRSKSGGQLSRFNPLTHNLQSNIDIRKKKAKRQPHLEPIQAIKLQAPNETLSQSKSVPQLPKIIHQSQNTSLNTTQLLNRLQSDEPLVSSLAQNPMLSERQLESQRQKEKERSQERDKVYKDIIQRHSDHKQIRDDKEALKYRDRKKSIIDMQNQGVDAQSYSKEGRRLDYLPFNI